MIGNMRRRGGKEQEGDAEACSAWDRADVCQCLSTLERLTSLAWVPALSCPTENHLVPRAARRILSLRSESERRD
jgi:hypothetical protein